MTNVNIITRFSTVPFIFNNRRPKLMLKSISIPWCDDIVELKGSCAVLNLCMKGTFSFPLMKAINDQLLLYTEQELDEKCKNAADIMKMVPLTEKVFSWLIVRNAQFNDRITSEDFTRMERFLRILSGYTNALSFLLEVVCHGDDYVYRTMLNFCWGRGIHTWQKLLQLHHPNYNKSRLELYGEMYSDPIKDFMAGHDAKNASKEGDNQMCVSLHTSPSLFKMLSLKKLILDIGNGCAWFELLPKNIFRRYFNSLGVSFQIPSVSVTSEEGVKRLVGVTAPAVPVISDSRNHAETKVVLDAYISKLNDIHALQIFHRFLNEKLTSIRFLEIKVPSCESKCFGRSTNQEDKLGPYKVDLCLHCQCSTTGSVDSRTFQKFCQCGFNGHKTRYMVLNRNFKNEKHDFVCATVYRFYLSTERGGPPMAEDIRKHTSGLKSNLDRVSSICLADRTCFNKVSIKLDEQYLNFKSTQFITYFDCQKPHTTNSCIDKFVLSVDGCQWNEWPANFKEHQFLIQKLLATRKLAVELLCSGCIAYLMCNCGTAGHNKKVFNTYCRQYLFPL